jgi:hypothetical protein
MESGSERLELHDERDSCLLCGGPSHPGECYIESEDEDLQANIATKMASFMLIVSGTIMLVLSSIVAVQGGVWRLALLTGLSGVLPFISGIFGITSGISSSWKSTQLRIVTALCLCGLMVHVLIAAMMLVNPEGVRSSLLSETCPAGLTCGSDVLLAENAYDEYEQVLLFGSMILAGVEAVAVLTVTQLLSVIAQEELTKEGPIDRFQFVAPPRLRYAVVAHLMLDDKVQITSSADLDDVAQTKAMGGDDSMHSCSPTSPSIDHVPVANHISKRCLEQAHGVLSQKLEVFICDDISSKYNDSNTRFPQQFLVAWVDLRGDPERTVTVGGLSSSIANVCFRNCDNIGSKAMAFVVVYDKEFPRSNAAHFMFAAMHDPLLCCTAGAWPVAHRNEVLFRLARSFGPKKGCKRCSREEQQMVNHLERQRTQNIEGVVEYDMARHLADQEKTAVKRKHEAALKCQFNRPMKGRNSSCCIS